MRLLSLLFCIGLSGVLMAQRPLTLRSPDHQIEFIFNKGDTAPFYRVMFKGKPLLDNSTLSLTLQEGGDFNRNLSFGRPSYREGREEYELVVGKTKKVLSHYNEVTIPLRERAASRREIDLVVRAFDDGLAFRYEFPEQPGLSSLILTDENSRFNFHGDPIAHALFLPNYTSSHEGLYTTLPVSRLTQDSLMDMPALFECADGNFVAITEAALVDYAGMYLVREGNSIRSRLSPLPGEPSVLVRANLPHKSPWRVLMIADEPGKLIESNILTNLNEPCRIEDVSWIKPGRTTFPWWNGNITPDTTFAPGNNFETNKYYIDFCAANHIEYHSVVEYGGHEWYVSDGTNFQPGPHNDVTRPVPGLDMQEVCDYAKTKGVGIRVWVHWKALYPRLEQAFTQFEKWGIKGMMVDFMDRDDQEMVQIQLNILKAAAKHHLHIQFHGAYKPTGLQRTYPNEFTREGTLNYENEKWSDMVNPDHDINIPFTRMLAGSTDYHLGGFRAVTREKFKPQQTRPLMLGTRCHMLAMYVVLENYIGMVCDYPEAYLGQPGFEFLQEVPTVWDETRVPSARVGEWVSIARRSGGDWYMGTISNYTGRDISVPLKFLPAGTYMAEMFSDAADANANPNHLAKKIVSVTNADTLHIHLAPGGGQAVHFMPK